MEPSSIRNPNRVQASLRSAKLFGDAVYCLLSNPKQAFRYSRILSCNCEYTAEMMLRAAIIAYGTEPDQTACKNHSLKKLFRQLSFFHDIEETKLNEIRGACIRLEPYSGPGRFPDSGIKCDISDTFTCLDDLDVIYGFVQKDIFAKEFGYHVESLDKSKRTLPETDIRYHSVFAAAPLIGKTEFDSWVSETKAQADSCIDLQNATGRFNEVICFYSELGAEMSLKTLLVKQGEPAGFEHDLSTLFDRVEKYFRISPYYRKEVVDTLNAYGGGGKYPEYINNTSDDRTKRAVEVMNLVYNKTADMINNPEKHLLNTDMEKPSVENDKIVIPVRTPKKKICLRMKPLPPKPEENEDGGALSSETARMLYGQQASERAQRMYEDFRKDDSDIALICASTGLSEDVISRVKNHLFIQEHDFPDGKHRFKPYYAVADSWKNLMSGTVRRHDILLLQHELLEMSLMDEGMSQRAAHETAGRYFDFEGQSRRYYEFIRSKDEAVPEKTVAKRKDTGRSSR